MYFNHCAWNAGVIDDEKGVDDRHQDPSVAEGGRLRGNSVRVCGARSAISDVHGPRLYTVPSGNA